MKIGLVCPYNIFKGGGVQECILALQAEFISQGHQALIITPRPRTTPAELPKDIVLVGAATDIKSPFHTTAQVSVTVDSKQLQTLLDTHKFDILHFHEPWVPMLSRQILTRSKSVNVATFHAKLPETVMSRTIEKVVTPYTKSILRYIDVFTAVSPAAASYVSSISNKPITIVPNGIDIKKYTHKTTVVSPNKNMILYVGRLEKRKGVNYLLQAFIRLKQDSHNVQLVLAGDGPDRNKLEQFVRDNKMTGVKFLGHISEQEKLVLLDEAQVFCSPALYGESFGIVLLEAMAKGLPIVAGNNAGYASVLKNKGALSLVNPKDSEDFARRLKIFLEDDDIRRVWTNWAKTYIQQFNYSHIAKLYLDAYAQAKKA